MAERRYGWPNDGSLEVLVEAASNGLWLRVSGDMDVHTAPKVSNALRNVEDVPASSITLDLSGVSFLDSRGVCALVQAAIRARDNGHRLTILTSRPVEHMIDLCGLRDKLPIAEWVQ